MKALHRQMKEKSIKTRQGCFSLLTELILVLPGALASHMNLLVPGVQFSLASSQSNSNMKIDTLSFVQVPCIMCNIKRLIAQTYSGIVDRAPPDRVPPPCSSAGACSDCCSLGHVLQDQQRGSSCPSASGQGAAQLDIAGLVSNHLSSQVLRPLDSSPTTFDFTLYTANIYSCCFVRLKAQDIDQEVIYIKPYPTSNLLTI